MATNQTIKKNVSSIQVLKTLQVLLEGSFSMQELVTKLNEKEKEPIFNNSVVSKYINTCRHCGIEIPKIQNKYIVTKLPFGLNLSTNDTELLKLMQDICRETFSTKVNKGFNTFISKLNKYSNKTILKVDRTSINISYEIFEKAIKEERKIRVTFKTNKVIDCIPLNIISYQKRTYFNIKQENKEKSIAVDKISFIELLDEKFKTPSFEQNETIFELKGALAERYNLRENENLIVNGKDKIIISNIGEDKNLLISRLLRYDSLCEIKAPAICRSKIKKVINDTLANYGE